MNKKINRATFLIKRDKVETFFAGVIAGILYKDPEMPQELVEYAALQITIKEYAKTHNLQRFIDEIDLADIDRRNIEKLYKKEKTDN